MYSPGHHPLLYCPEDDEQRVLTAMLVREAKVCLRNPSLSVQQVAEMLGFSDQSAFGKFFKRECGMSPVQYKKETQFKKQQENNHYT